MTKSRRLIYLLATGTLLLLTAAAFCLLAGNPMDILFLGAGIVLSVITFNEYQKFKEDNRARTY